MIELETANNAYVFARDYRRAFARLGCEPVRSMTIDRQSHPEVSDAYHGYVAHLLRVPAAAQA